MTVSVVGHLSKLYAIGDIWLLILPAHFVKELCSVEGIQRRGHRRGRHNEVRSSGVEKLY